MRGSPEWLDHGEMIVAELRPVMGKNALRWAIPANPSDASKPKRSARSR